MLIWGGLRKKGGSSRNVGRKGKGGRVVGGKSRKTCLDWYARCTRWSGEGKMGVGVKNEGVNARSSE